MDAKFYQQSTGLPRSRDRFWFGAMVGFGAGIILAGVAMLLLIQPSRVSNTVYNTNQEEVVIENQESSLAHLWEPIPDELVLQAAIQAEIPIFPESGIFPEMFLDLNGDGMPEGVYSGDGGNSSVTFIVLQTDGVPRIARQLNRDGSFRSVSLTSVGRAAYSLGYELLPDENGFYSFSKSRDEQADNNMSSNFFCSSFNAYRWNPAREIFEWDDALTRQHIVDVCN